MLSDAVDSVAAVGRGSASNGAGGGVVSIVQPIQPDITRTSRTKSRTGIPIAHCCQYIGNPMNGAKKAAM